MSTLKMFAFTAVNEVTGESIQYKGQGTSFTDAASDGIKGLTAVFRPKQDGRSAKPGEIGGPVLVAVTTKAGVRVNRPLKEFEGEEPFAGPLPTFPEPKTAEEIRLPPRRRQ